MGFLITKKGYDKYMKIQVLGSGCPTCKKLYEITKQAVEELNIDAQVEYITDVQKLVELGVLTSPVLVIDNKPVLAGAISNIEKIKQLISEAR
jgi:small redox-active disulfide protein 2